MIAIQSTMEELDDLFNLLDRAVDYCDDQAIIDEAKSIVTAFSDNKYEVPVVFSNTYTPVCAAVPLLAQLVPCLCQALISTLKLDTSKEALKLLRLKRITPLLRDLLHKVDAERVEACRYQGPDFIFNQGDHWSKIRVMGKPFASISQSLTVWFEC